jgi:hypothetical protein
MGLFLPFLEPAKSFELEAIRVKRHLGLGPYASVDPLDVLPDVPARIVPAAVFEAFSPADRDTLLNEFPSDWSAYCVGECPRTGEFVIVVNHTHHEHRTRVSIMEEIVHIVLKHPPSRLTTNSNGTWRRTHNEDIEDEAYAVGAACMIPYRQLFNSICHEARDVAGLAADLNVSEQYLNYRIKRAGLARVYQKKQRQQV